MKVDAFFHRHPVFTSDEFRAYLASVGTENPKTQRNLLDYHAVEGRVARVRRGLYAVVPPGQTPESVAVDPYLVASRAAPDSVVAYHSALELQSAAYSVHSEVTFLTARAVRPFSFGGLAYRGVSFPKALVEKGEELFAVRTVDRAGLPVRTTSLERTLVDVLDRANLSGGWEEVWRSLEGIAYVDIETVARYAALLGNATTTAKVGYFLDEHRAQLMVDEPDLEPFEEGRPAQPHYVFDARRGEGQFVGRWNLIVPGELATRAWEEAL